LGFVVLGLLRGYGLGVKGFRVQSFGFGAWDLGFRVKGFKGLGSRAEDSQCRIQGSGFRFQGFGLWALGLGFRV